MLCRDMEPGVLASDITITHACRKDAPEDKNPPEGNGPCLLKVIS